jgi:hypothetical protein
MLRFNRSRRVSAGDTLLPAAIDTTPNPASYTALGVKFDQKLYFGTYGPELMILTLLFCGSLFFAQPQRLRQSNLPHNLHLEVLGFLLRTYCDSEYRSHESARRVPPAGLHEKAGADAQHGSQAFSVGQHAIQLRRPLTRRQPLRDW